MERGGQEQDDTEYEQRRKKAFQRSDIAGAIATRWLISERVRHPSESESRDAIALITSDVLNPTFQDRTSVGKLKEFKEVTANRFGPLSTPHLSASVIYSIAKSLKIEAIQDFKKNELSSIPIMSVYIYDVSEGIMDVVSTIRNAEDAIKGISDGGLERFLTDHFPGQVNLSDQADLFLREKAEALEYAKLLKKDPTGRNLIRHAVEEIENPKTSHAFWLREFVVHGARFAESAYGIVYPLVEKINQPT